MSCRSIDRDIDFALVAMPQDHLQLQFINDFDGSGKLLAHVTSAGFSGKGGAYFSIDEIVGFAASLTTFL